MNEYVVYYTYNGLYEKMYMVEESSEDAIQAVENVLVENHGYILDNIEIDFAKYIYKPK